LFVKSHEITIRIQGIDPARPTLRLRQLLVGHLRTMVPWRTKHHGDFMIWAAKATKLGFQLMADRYFHGWWCFFLDAYLGISVLTFQENRRLPELGFAIFFLEHGNNCRPFSWGAMAHGFLVGSQRLDKPQTKPTPSLNDPLHAIYWFHWTT